MKQTVGTVPGGQDAKCSAELQPVTMRLIVAVTPEEAIAYAADDE